jgi:hypothetical protein
VARKRQRPEDSAAVLTVHDERRFVMIERPPEDAPSLRIPARLRRGGCSPDGDPRVSRRMVTGAARVSVQTTTSVYVRRRRMAAARGRNV